MKDWFASREPRERAILIAGGAVAVLIILWSFVIRPLHTGTVALRQAVATKQRLLVDLGRVAGSGVSGAAKPAKGRGNDQTLSVLVDSTAREHGLSLPRIRPEGTDGVNITFQNASFDALLGWLISLDSEHSVAVESASFSSAREQGLVNGQLLLRRS
jgi:general secretion pathway protein M